MKKKRQELFKFKLNKQYKEFEIIGFNAVLPQEIVIPERYRGLFVTSIGSSAFENAQDLRTIIISKKINIIKSGAFKNCISLTSISIPDSVGIIEEGAFEGCINLTNIEVDINNQQYSSIDGVLYNKNQTELIF